jgi:hypothetical protein
MEFVIVEVDRDYRVETDRQKKDFPSKEAAEEFCRKESGIGYDYHIELSA